MMGTTSATSVVVLDTVRALLRAQTEEEVVRAVIEAVRDLGGRVAPPTGRSDELPLDLTFGIGDPLIPRGDADTLEVLARELPLLAEDAAIALARVRREVQLCYSAETDALTGLGNRRVTMRALGRLSRGDSVVLIDLDRFKVINDTLGHDAGDDVLRSFARALHIVLRSSDTAGRLGGEEFALLLPRTGSEGALHLLGRLRESWVQVRPHPVTFSAGVAAVGDQPPRHALTRADQAMYLAKLNGRDRTEVADG